MNFAPSLRHPVDLRRRDILRAVTAEIAVTEIIGQDDDEVRLLRGFGGTDEPQRTQRAQSKEVSWFI